MRVQIKDMFKEDGSLNGLPYTGKETKKKHGHGLSRKTFTVRCGAILSLL